MGEHDWFAGVDTHADTHALCVIDEAGRIVCEGEFPAAGEGYRALERALGGPDRCARVAIEACGSYGRGVAEHLRDHGYEVSEALRPGRRPYAPEGKTDAIDAHRAAVIAARDEGSPLKGFGGPAETLSYLVAARNGAVAEATALSNALLGQIRRSPAEIRERLEGRRPEDTVRAVERARVPEGRRAGIVLALKSQARRWRLARREADELEAQMARIVNESYRRLLALPGVSVITAAAIAAIAGDEPSRIRSEAAFAKMLGACPIPASSGRTERHRLFRGGNRAGNCALHRIVVTRLAHDERTRAYMQRRMGEGKTKPEVIRCLVRYVARELYRALLSDEPAPVEDLRARRRALGLSLEKVAEKLSTNIARLSRLERNLIEDGPFLRRYDDFLQTRETECEIISKSSLQT